MVDTSSSISYSQFQLIREFIANITVEVISKSSSSAVGVILFNDTAHIEFDLKTYTNLSALLSAISQLPYSGGKTNIFNALRTLLLSGQNGLLKLRKDSSKVAVVITNEEFIGLSVTSYIAATLHDVNMFDVFAIGAEGTNLTQLQAIASSPELVFAINSFSRIALQQLQDQVIPEMYDGKYSFEYISTQFSQTT